MTPLVTWLTVLYVVGSVYAIRAWYVKERKK